MSQFYQKDDASKRPITIIEDKESFYRLSDGQMIKKDVFPKYYMPLITESFTPKQNGDILDPDSFFNTKHSIPVEKIKTVDTSRMRDTVEEGATVLKNTTNQVGSVNKQIPTDTFVKPMSANQPIPNNTNTDVSQYKVYDNDEDAYDDFVKKSQHPQPQPQSQPKVNEPQQIISEIDRLFEDEKMSFGEEEALKRKETRLKRSNIDPSGVVTNTEVQQTVRHQEQSDPSEIMFKTFKRNYEISINLIIKDKIGKPEFVRMMMENIDGDIIKYYKKLIMNNIMNNIKYIEDEVEKNLRMEIFGDEDDIEITENDIKEVIEETKPKKSNQRTKKSSNEKKPRQTKTKKVDVIKEDINIKSDDINTENVDTTNQ